MTTQEDIRRGMAALAQGKPVTLLGKVTSVDRQERTCGVDDDGVVVPGIRLQAITGNGHGLVVYPKTGAQALALRVEQSDEYMLLSASEVDGYELEVGGKSIKVTDEGIVMNGGSLGLAKVDELAKWMQAVYDDLQTLAGLLSASPVAGNGAPLGIAFTPTTLQPNRSAFEDTAVKH